MRACLAILQDSFREAAASRILWIAFVVIAGFLAIVAPFGLRMSPSTQLRPYELVDAQRLLQTVDDERVKAGTASAHLWTLLTKDQQAQLIESSEKLKTDSPDRRRNSSLQREVLDTLNGLLEKPEFYKPENWPQDELPEEIRAADPGELTAAERASRNLRRLAVAFPESISIQDDTAMSLTYGSLTLFGPLRIGPSQLQQLIDEILINFLPWVVGFFGVFGSLLVTASIIPRTFEPGEISLLLSKPVLRWVLFVTKFLGGCVFTALCATLFLSGLWLILWLRFDIWRPSLLWCIPLYIFLFAIYFSVSAFAGAVWRNATVSLILVVVFWVVVTTAGVVHSWAENVYLRSRQISEIAAAGDEIFMVDGSRGYHRWDSTSSTWSPILDDPKTKSFEQVMQRLFSATGRTRIAAMPDGSRIASLVPEFNRSSGATRATLITGTQTDNYVRETNAMTPEEVFGVFLSRNGDVIVPGVRSIYQHQGGVGAQAIEQWAGPVGQRAMDALWKLSGNRQTRAAAKEWELLSSPDLKSLSRNASVAFNPQDDSLVRWDIGTLSVLNRSPDGRYLSGPVSESADKEPAMVASGGSVILTALKNGTVRAVDKSTLEQIAETRLPDGEIPKQVEFSPTGLFGAVLTHNKHVLLFDSAACQFLSWVPAENGSVAALGFSADGQLMIAGGRRDLKCYHIPDGSVTRTLDEPEAWPYQVFDYIIRPIHALLPRPSDLDPAVRYLVTGEKSVAIGPQDGPAGGQDLNRQRIAFDFGSSIRSNLTFICAMLVLSCLYLSRKDF